MADDKLRAIGDYASSPLFEATERVALEYADAMTITGLDVSDELFARLRERFDDDAIVEKTKQAEELAKRLESQLREQAEKERQAVWEREQRLMEMIEQQRREEAAREEARRREEAARQMRETLGF